MLEYMLDQIDVNEDDEYWEAWYALPLSLRDWLLWYVPGWWSLPAHVFRRLLLRTAYLIHTRGLPPRLALRRVATRLRLPPPRPTRRMLRAAPRAAMRPRGRAPLARAVQRPPATRPARSRSPVARPRSTPSFRGGGFRGGGFRGRFR